MPEDSGESGEIEMFKEVLNNKLHRIISDEEKNKYYSRISIPYFKNNEKKTFITQFKKGSGGE